MSEVELRYASYFGRRCHIINARKEHTCRLCQGTIQPNTKCIRVFRPLSEFIYNKPLKKGWIQLFYHIECVERDWKYQQFKKEQNYEAQIKKCQSKNCPNFLDGHCLIRINGTVYVDAFDLCER